MPRKKKSDDKKCASAKMDMTPMIDVTFLLLVFFLCATKFKQLERRLDAFIPKDVPSQGGEPPPPFVDLDIKVRTVTREGETIPRVTILNDEIDASYNCGDPSAYWAAVGETLRGYKDGPFEKTVIDATDNCAWEFVALTLDQCIAQKLKSVTFAAKR
ncbi:MAG: biopolymer transporter ExbD [Planctomycetes bacterium]|nr:biopolymer transporter ExbD [Planctomycetota bacterium]